MARTKKKRATGWWMALGAICCLLAAGQTPRAAQNNIVQEASYRNPVGQGLTMGDPFVTRYGSTYYLTGTTKVGRGFELWTSNNLADWAPRGFAFSRTAQSWAQKSLWAPELFQYRGKYYLTYSAEGLNSNPKKPAFRLGLAVATSPRGPYRDLYAPWCDTGVACIDAHVMIDADGTPYLYFAQVGAREKPTLKLLAQIYGARLKEDLSGLASEPVLCVEATQPWETPEQGRSLCNEGATVFKHGDRYYLTYSANHYAEPFYGIGYATSKSPLGPWTKPSDSRLLVANEKLGLSGPGHNSITTSPDGKERFIVYHAHQDPSRPEGPRTVNVDRLILEKDRSLRVEGPTRSPQPLPSGVVSPVAR